MKKVLIITYYWPPAGGPGVQRVLKFVKYLPKFGWQPIILTVENGNFPAFDYDLLKEIPEDLKVYRAKSFEPFDIYKKLTGKKKTDILPTYALNKTQNESGREKIFRWIRANIFIPDGRIGWINNLVKEGLRIIRIEKPDIIFSSSPPHSLQIGAKKLASKSGLKWVADFRDPWTDGFWLKYLNRNKLSCKIDNKFEEKVISSADGIITVSNSILKDFQNKYNIEGCFIENGFDEKDFEGLSKNRQDKFKVTYSGSLRKSQFPYKLISAVKNLHEKNLINSGKFQIDFWGHVHPDFKNLIIDNNLCNYFSFNGYISHSESVKKIIDSDILLLAIPDTENNKGIITGKLFEYLRTGNFILCLGPKDGEAADIIARTESGETFDYSEKLDDFIIGRYNFWLSNKEFYLDIQKIKNYSRENLSKKLSDFLDSKLILK